MAQRPNYTAKGEKRAHKATGSDAEALLALAVAFRMMIREQDNSFCRVEKQCRQSQSN